MRQFLFGITVLAIACASGAYGSPVPEERTFQSSQVGVSFVYPAAWGETLVRDYRNTPSYADYGMDWQIRFATDPQPCRACLLVRQLTSGANLRIVAYEGSVDTTDLDVLRRATSVSPDRTVNGCPARVADMYFEPAGEAWRVTSWFADGRFYEFREAARVHEFEDAGEGEGLELGVTQLCRANPADDRLADFTKATARLLDSIRW